MQVIAFKIIGKNKIEEMYLQSMLLFLLYKYYIIFILK